MKRQSKSRPDQSWDAISYSSTEQLDGHEEIKPSALERTFDFVKNIKEKHDDLYDRGGLIAGILDVVALALFALLIPIVIPVVLIVLLISDWAHPSRTTLHYSFEKMNRAADERHKKYVTDILAKAKELNKRNRGRYYYYQYNEDIMDSKPWDGKEPPELGLLDRHPQ